MTKIFAPCKICNLYRYWYILEMLLYSYFGSNLMAIDYNQIFPSSYIYQMVENYCRNLKERHLFSCTSLIKGILLTTFEISTVYSTIPYANNNIFKILQHKVIFMFSTMECNNLLSIAKQYENEQDCYFLGLKPCCKNILKCQIYIRKYI